MGYDSCVRIERATNGYVVSMKDPKIAAANLKRSNKSDFSTPWQEERREYVFTDLAAVTKFLTANLDKALPKVDYDSSFDSAVEDDD